MIDFSILEWNFNATRPSFTSGIKGWQRMSLERSVRQPCRISLPSARPLTISLSDALKYRVSSRPEGEGRGLLQLEDLSTLLFWSASRSANLQSYPSAGARYPIEMFLYAQKVSDIKQGWYFYPGTTHELWHWREPTQLPRLFAVEPSSLGDAAVLLVSAAVFRRSMSKYGEKGYRFALYEAGHIAQNLCLVATGLRLPICSWGGVYDHHVAQDLGLDGMQEAPLYTLLLWSRN